MQGDSLTGVSNLSASLGPTGRRVVLGDTLNTLRHIITKQSHHVLSKFMILCWAAFTAILGCVWSWATGWTPLWDMSEGVILLFRRLLGSSAYTE